MDGVWGKLGQPTTIQLTSSSPGSKLTKADIRRNVWDFLEKFDLVNFPRPVHNRIPNFKGAATAGQLFASLPEFKKACVVKVNPDKPQEEVRYQVLDHKKTLLVPTPRLRSGLFNLIESRGSSTKQHLKMLASRQGIDKESKPLPLTYKNHIDMVVLGCVAVDKQGHRIGKGEGYADLEYAMAASSGTINEDTIVVATVHDCQLFETLPEEIFGEHDVPIDIIITPTLIHRVEKRLPKPNKIIWEILTQEKFKRIPILRQILEEERLCEKRSKESVKSDASHLLQDSKLRDGRERDEVTKKNSMYDQPRKDEQSNYDRNDSETSRTKHLKDNDFKYQQWRDKRSNYDRNHSDTSRTRHVKDDFKKVRDDRSFYRDEDKEFSRGRNVSSERNKQDRNEHFHRDHEGRRGDSKRERDRSDDQPFLFVGKIPKTARVRDLKEALLERSVRPVELVWKGFKGYAFLYFEKTEDINEIYRSLQGLALGEDVLEIQEKR